MRHTTGRANGTGGAPSPTWVPAAVLVVVSLALLLGLGLRPRAGEGRGESPPAAPEVAREAPPAEPRLAEPRPDAGPGSTRPNGMSPSNEVRGGGTTENTVGDGDLRALELALAETLDAVVVVCPVETAVDGAQRDASCEGSDGVGTLGDGVLRLVLVPPASGRCRLRGLAADGLDLVVTYPPRADPGLVECTAVAVR